MRTPLLALPLLLALAGCPGGGGAGGGSAAGPGELNLLIYSEYIDPAILEDYTKATGQPVRVTLFESTEEVLAKLQHAGADTQYDVVVVANQAVPALVRLGLVQALDPAKLPHLDQLAPRFRDPRWDPGCKHSVPYQWGTLGLLYDARKLPDLPPSWGVMFDPAQRRGTYVLLDETRDQLGAALRFAGHSVNATAPEQVKQAGELVLGAKSDERCQGFEGGVGGKNRVVAGSVDMAVVWNGDAVRALGEAEAGRLAFVVPREGSTLWCDVMMVPRGAPDAAAAHRFIDFLLQPEVGARLSNFTRYATPNAGALGQVREEDRNNQAIYPSEEVLQTLESVDDLGDATRLYDEVWTAVKSR